MASSQEIVASYSRLQTALRQILQKQSAELAIRQEGDYPLLVLETSSDSAGFATVNGTPEAAFKNAYAAFKQLYREKHSAWKELNLSFVVCRLELKTIDDAFFSSIETDLYFCRKYVLCLYSDQQGLQKELLRLPFLPLPEGHSGGVVRPPSAQTLLQNLGIPASLARHVVVPRERSASSIVKDMIAQTEPLPDIDIAAISDAHQDVEPTERTRIKGVAIEAFRAYRKKQEFDLDADVVVLYGPNGLGKTSFFDAIDYVCTGRIGRLCRRSRMKQEDFMNLARHLDTQHSAGSVTMELSKGSSTVLVRRKVDDWSHAFVGKDKFDRTNTLQFLTSANWGEKKERIENLERLFRATHLFSQTAPELLVKFENDSVLPADLVSRTLALEDYASGRAKVEEVLTLLDGQINEEEKQLMTLRTQLEKVQDQIKVLPAPRESVQIGQQLKNMAAELVKELRTGAGVTVEDTAVTSDSVWEWRVITEAALKDARDRLLKLQTLESDFAQYEKNKAGWEAKSKRLKQLDVELQKYGTERTRLEEAKKKLLGELKQSKNALSQAKAKRSALAELEGLQDIARELQDSLQQWRQELKRIEGEAAVAETEMRRLLPAREKLETRKSEVQEEIDFRLRRVQKFIKVRDGLAAWEVAKIEASELQKSVTTAQSHLKMIRVSIDEQQRLIDVRAGELEEREREYEKLTANQAELTRLLEELESHVRDGVCPTCGTDHRTKMALLERIHAQKEARPAHVEEFAKCLHELRSSLEKTKTSIASLNRKKELKKKELEELSGKLAAKQELMATFARSIEQAGLSVDDQELCATVDRLLAEETAANQASQDILEKIKVEEADVVRRIKELEKRQSQTAEARKRANDAIEPLEQQMRILHSKAEALGLSLDVDSAELLSERENWVAREAQAARQVTEITSKEELLTQAAAEVEALLDEAKASAETTIAEKEAFEREIAQYEGMAAGTIKRDALNLIHIIEQVKDAAERVEVLEKLTRRALTVERAFDFAQRSALVAELESKVYALTMQKQDIDKKMQRMSVVKKWFSQINDILNKRNADAVGNYVRALGPLTTLTQRRLRTVYGFGDVSLQPKGSEIRVLVSWRSENVKPTDYFSDSQKQILMLSLFLSGRLTQTWSGFAPILLDDPVTHFDDLNAFGFVELIRGLISTSLGKRQFFISTCEERLFELMRQKFGKIDGGARFYRFEGIEADGPIITTLEH
ncbi:MAG: AAA family ATPase [Bacillota bacterium]